MMSFAPTVTAQATKAATKVPAKAKTPAASPLKFVTAPDGNMARYRVREQLVGVDLPNDAVGNTGGITGSIMVGADGKLVASESKFVVDLKPLKSDSGRRDGFVQRRLLETETYPTATLALTEIRALSTPIPTSGAASFLLIGDFTVKGVTKPTTWSVKGTIQGDVLKGTATTGFTFADFNMTKPRVPVLLSVNDSIHLEYDFNLIKVKQ